MRMIRNVIAAPAAILALVCALVVPAQADDEKLPTLLATALAVNADTGEFSTLIAAVLCADEAVVGTLAGKGQHTVFAPTDTAFSNAGGFTEDNICELPQDLLTTILLYHVVHGRLLAEDVLASDRLNTLLRGRDGFLGQGGGVLYDNSGGASNIIAIDVEASNGVIHVIDAVVFP